MNLKSCLLNSLQGTCILAGLWIRIHFFRIRIRIQSMMLETNTDPDPIRIQGFNDQKLKKLTAENFLLFFLSKTAIYLSLGLH